MYSHFENLPVQKAWILFVWFEMDVSFHSRFFAFIETIGSSVEMFLDWYQVLNGNLRPSINGWRRGSLSYVGVPFSPSISAYLSQSLKWRQEGMAWHRTWGMISLVYGSSKTSSLLQSFFCCFCCCFYLLSSICVTVLTDGLNYIRGKKSWKVCTME